MSIDRPAMHRPPATVSLKPLASKMRFTLTMASVVAAGIAANAVYYFRPCYFHACIAADGVFSLSASKDKREFAARAVSEANDRYSALFRPSSDMGALLLDRDIERPLVVKYRSSWVLRFDPFRPTTVSGLFTSRELADNADLFDERSVSGGTGKGIKQPSILGNRFEVTKHEICHMLFSSSMAGARYTDAIDEVAAISCESDPFLSARTQQFFGLAARGEQLPWNDFLVMRHPIKSRVKLMKLLEKGVLRAKGSVMFNLNSETGLAKEVDRFYAQAAAFASVWKVLCPDRPVLSDLAIHLNRGMAFSSWLETSGIPCVPRSVAAFDDAVVTLNRL